MIQQIAIWVGAALSSGHVENLEFYPSLSSFLAILLNSFEDVIWAECQPWFIEPDSEKIITIKLKHDIFPRRAWPQMLPNDQINLRRSKRKDPVPF